MENIHVSIRVRPLNKQEAAKGTPWKLSSSAITLVNGSSTSTQPFTFDRVFGMDSKTGDIYDAHTKRIIASAVQGFNGTIFAYGQTSSGKTFTMRGSQEEPGIIPLAIQDVFRNIQEEHNREFLLRVSYMEIYNEEIRDLLAPENSKLQVHESVERGIFVAGLREEIVVSPEQVLELMEFGEAHRHTGETNMNVHSSRSHTIFRMVIESRDRSQDDPSDRALLQISDPVRVSHLNLVDLAGSERVNKTGAEGTRLKEGTHINKSLMTLGNVINKLSEGIEKQGGHVPYRDSKLTRILQPALGGNAKTLIICNITPALVHVDETRGTLQFASRANRVTNCAQVNEIMTDAALLKRQKKEIAELRKKLQESPSEQWEEEILNLRNELLKTELEKERMAMELQESQKVQAERERRIKEQQQKIENLSTMVINSAVDDRDFEKRSKKGNRRETWCARPLTNPALELHDLKKPFQKDASILPSVELSMPINKKRSFGLPPPFEKLIEEDGPNSFLSKGSSFSFDESLEDGSISESFSLPEPGAQSFVGERRRRSSIEWITGNEVEQQISDLQAQYDSLQCEHVIKMQEKDSEIEELKRDLAYAHSFHSKNGGKDMRNQRSLDVERRGKSLDGWKESESVTTIKQLRAQVRNLETEKLYMQRELDNVLDQAREQSNAVKQELQEVYQELNDAKEESVDLNSQLELASQQIQKLLMEKCSEKHAYLQLAAALTDLETEVASILQSPAFLQSYIQESLQVIRTSVKAFQECLVDARNFGSLANIFYENKTSMPNFMSEAVICREPVREQCDPSDGGTTLVTEEGTGLEEAETDPCTMEARAGKPLTMDNTQGLLTTKLIQSQIMITKSSGYLDENACPEPECLVELSHGDVDRIDTNIEHAPASEHEHPASYEDCVVKNCVPVPPKAEEDSLINEREIRRLKEENQSLIAVVKSLQSQIKLSFKETQPSLLRITAPEEELEMSKVSIPQIELEDKSRLSTTGAIFLNGENAKKDSTAKELECVAPAKDMPSDSENRRKSVEGLLEMQNTARTYPSRGTRKGLLEEQTKEEQSYKEFTGLESRESEQEKQRESLQRDIPSVEVQNNLESELHRLDEEKRYLTGSLENLSHDVELATKDKDMFTLREASLEENLEGVMLALPALEDEENLSAEISGEEIRQLDRRERDLRRIADKLLTARHGSGRMMDEQDSKTAHNISIDSRVDDNVCLVELEVDWAIEEWKRLQDSIVVLQGKVELGSTENEGLLQREESLRDEIQKLKIAVQSLEDERIVWVKVGEDSIEQLDRREKDLERITSKLLTARYNSGQTVEGQEFEIPLQSSPDSEAVDKAVLLEQEVDWVLEERKHLYETAELLQGKLDFGTAEKELLLQKEACLGAEVDQLNSSIRCLEDEKDKLKYSLQESRDELERHTADMRAIMRKLDSGDSVLTEIGGEEENFDRLNSQIDRFVQEKKNLKDTLAGVHESLQLATKETETLLLKEAGLAEEVMNLKSTLQLLEDERKAMIEAKLQEEDELKKRLADLQKAKDALITTAEETDRQLQDFRATAAEAYEELERWQQRYQSESSQFRSEITSLRKELSVAKSAPAGLSKERDSLQRDLDKNKAKMKEVEAKLKTTLQDKSKLETEKLNMERELKQLRQSTSMQRDINRRDSVVDQRRQSIALGLNKTKHQLTSVENALQLKTEEAERLTYELHSVKESYAKLEFAMAEAEGYSNEKVAELEAQIVRLNEEKFAATENIERLRKEVEMANQECKSKIHELESLRNEFASLNENLRANEDHIKASEISAADLAREKEEIVQELIDAHINFQMEKAALTTQAQENRDKCNILNLEIISLTEELQKLKDLQEESSDANRLLQDRLQEALESNSEKSLVHHKQIKLLEADVDSYKDRCRELEKDIEIASRREEELRMSGSFQLEHLRNELQQCLMKLSASEDAKDLLSSESHTLLIANTKLQFALDASRDRLEVFEGRLDESDWELTEFKTLLQKAGFIRGDAWNLVSLQQFEKHIKNQNDEARRLETELADKKLEIIELEVEYENMKNQCDEYQEEIRYLQTKVLSPEDEKKQQSKMFELAEQNRKLQAHLRKAEIKAQEFAEIVKAREGSLTSLQTTLESLHTQNARLEKDLVASKIELQSTQQLNKIAMRAGAIGKSTTPIFKPGPQDRAKVPFTSQSATSTPTFIERSPAFETQDSKSLPTTKGSPATVRRIPLSENAAVTSVHNFETKSEGKSARSLLTSSKLPQSLHPSTRQFVLPECRSLLRRNKENL